MTGHVQHVVHAPHDPEITVLIFARAVARKVRARNLRPVLLHVTIGIAIDCSQHGRPWLPDDEITTRAQRHRLALHVHDLRHDAEERTRGRTGLGRNRARNRCDHDGAGFRLPPGIHDRTAVMADHLAIPHPRLGVDRLTDCAEQTQAFHLVFFRPLVAPLGEGADGGRRGVKHVHLMPVDDRPETIGLRTIRRPFIHEAGGAALQRPIHDIAMPSDPADVGGTPVGIFFAQVKNIFRREISSHRVATGGVHNAFRLTRRARSVKNVQRVFGIERLGRALIRSFRHQFMPPVVAARGAVNRRACALVDHHMLH